VRATRPFPLQAIARCVIERLVESVGAVSAFLCEATEVLQGGTGLIMAASAVAYGAMTRSSLRPLEPQPGYAKARILIVQVEVARIVGDSEPPKEYRAPRHIQICRRTTNSCVWVSKRASGERITSAGIRYSNMEPDQEISAESTIHRRDGATK